MPTGQHQQLVQVAVEVAVEVAQSALAIDAINLRTVADALNKVDVHSAKRF